MRPVLLALLLLLPAASPAWARSAGARCLAACQRHVRDVLQQARVCNRCVFTGADAGSWLEKLSKVPDGALADEDWQVRWAVMRHRAKAKKIAPERALAAWIARASGDEREVACVTALFVAGSKSMPLARLLSAKTTGDPSAATTCVQATQTLKQRIEPELYATDASRRLEALTHLASALDVGVGRVVLDAVAVRGEDSDDIAAALLVEHYENGGPPAGLALLRDATAQDTAAMDRLLKIYARERDRKRPLLTSPQKEVRLEGLRALAAIAPLSQSELTAALDDKTAAVRAKAAYSLAKGEGRTVTQAAAARLEPDAPNPVKERVQWLGVLGELKDEGCAGLTRPLWHDEGAAEAVRAAAVVALAGCAGKAALPDVTEAVMLDTPGLRAAGLEALAVLPRGLDVEPLVRKGLGTPSPRVVEAALAAASAHRLRRLAPDAQTLSQSAHEPVRVAAVKALAVLDAPKAQAAGAKCLKDDPSAQARAACAAVLGEVGGPQAAAALTRARLNEQDPTVKFVVDESLARLGLLKSR